MHPVFNHSAPYGYMLHTVYLFMADIANPDLVVCCRTWRREGSTQFAQQFVTAVIAPPHVCCIVWSPVDLVSSVITTAGSVHKSRGDNVVCILVQLKRLCVMCV